MDVFLTAAQIAYVAQPGTFSILDSSEEIQPIYRHVMPVLPCFAKMWYLLERDMSDYVHDLFITHLFKM